MTTARRRSRVPRRDAHRSVAPHSRGADVLDPYRRVTTFDDVKNRSHEAKPAMTEKSRNKPGGGAAPQGERSGGRPAVRSLRAVAADNRDRGKSQQLVAEFLKRQSAEDGVGMATPSSIGAAFFEMTARMMSDPSRLVQAQLSLWNDYLTLWQRTTQRFLGGEHRADDRTAGRGPAVPRRGVDRQHALRLHQAELSADGALAARNGQARSKGSTSAPRARSISTRASSSTRSRRRTS